MKTSLVRACSMLCLLLASACTSAWSTHPTDHGLSSGEDGGTVSGGDQFGVQHACADCHQQAFAATTKPPHAINRFSMVCEGCHASEVVWEQIAFPVHPTSFPLTGKHDQTACTSCHGAQGAAASPTCATCHMTDYTGTTNPSHVDHGFATTCQTCHTTNAWQPAGVDHTNLAGQTCISCHAAEYNATSQPNHAMVGFPDTCASCHSTTAWVPSTFNHMPFFPIASGRHAVPCATCHTVATSYAQFSCLNGCHSRDHHQTGNALADSMECYRCHPAGRN